VNANTAGDALNALGRDVAGQLANDLQRVAVHRSRFWAAAVTVILVLEHERAVATHTTGEVRVARRDQHEIAVDGAIRGDRAGAVHDGMEAIGRTEEGEGRALRQEFRRRAGDEQLARRDIEERAMRVTIVDRDAERGMRELGSIDDPAHPSGERGRPSWGLRLGGGREQARGAHPRGEGSHGCGQYTSRGHRCKLRAWTARGRPSTPLLARYREQAKDVADERGQRELVLLVQLPRHDRP